MKKAKFNKNIAFYVVAFLVVGAIVLTGASPAENSQRTDSAVSKEAVSVQPVETEKISTDEISEASLVASLAESANLSIAPNTASLSVSLSVLQNVAVEASGVTEKPKILEVSGDSGREIKTYRANTEESVASIAKKFGITADTLKWSNQISGDNIVAGAEVKILPIDGVLYKVKSGDKLADVAKKYGSSVEKILLFNNIEESDFKSGVELILPGGILPENERPGYVAPRQTVSTPQTTTTDSDSSSLTSTFEGADGSYVPSSTSQILTTNFNAQAGNAYAWGNCTWYVYNLRPDIGSFWGDARSWAYSAMAAGYTVNQTPAVGAIAQWNAYVSGMGVYGHVAYVEAVHADGTITISEMNLEGLAVTSRRTIPASSVSNFIH